MRLRYALLTAILLLLCSTAHAQTLWNNSNTMTFTGSGTVSQSDTVAAPCSPNCAAFVPVTTVSTGGYPTVTATYNAVSMISCGTPQQEMVGSVFVQIAWFVLVNPSTGSNTLAVSASGGGVTVSQTKVNLISYTGVDQTTPVRGGTYQGTSSAGATIALTITSDTQDITTTATQAGSNVPNLNSSSQTVDGAQNSVYSAGSDHEDLPEGMAPPSSVTHTWTYSTTADAIMLGFSIKAATFVPPACMGSVCVLNSCRINYWGSTNTNTCTMTIAPGNTLVVTSFTITTVCPDYSITDTQMLMFTQANYHQCGPDTQIFGDGSYLVVGTGLCQHRLGLGHRHLYSARSAIWLLVLEPLSNTPASVHLIPLLQEPMAQWEARHSAAATSPRRTRASTSSAAVSRTKRRLLRVPVTASSRSQSETILSRVQMGCTACIRKAWSPGHRGHTRQPSQPLDRVSLGE